MAAGSAGVEYTTQTFLDKLAAAGGKPLEQLAPAEARAVLSGLQAGAASALPDAVAGVDVDVDVDVVATRYSNLIHDYGLLNPISQVPATRAALLQAGEELKKRLK